MRSSKLTMDNRQLNKFLRIGVLTRSLCFVLLASCSFSSFAQDVKAISGIDSTVILIGNQTKLHIKVSYDAKPVCQKYSGLP